MLHITATHSRRQAPLRHLATTSPCPLTRQLATDRLQALVREENRHLVQLSLSRDAARRSIAAPQPIPCGLRNASSNPGFIPEGHWYFSRMEAKEARKLQKMVDEWHAAFGTSIEKSLAMELSGAGKSLKSALKAFGLEFFLDAPEALRKGEHSGKIKEVIVKKVTGRD